MNERFIQSNKRSTDHAIAIVGFGLSGVATFCQLVDKLVGMSATLATKNRILLFEKDHGQFATGLPYANDLPLIWTLNNPAAKFKLLPNGPTMADWMGRNKEKWQPLFKNINEEYPPRALVGLFLVDQYECYKNKALSHGIAIDKHLEEVIDVNKKNDKWSLITDQNQYLVNKLFLCLGHAPNNQFAHLNGQPNFFPINTRMNDLKRIPQQSDIYIIGGQATFVDITIWLAYVKHHTGHIHTITRNPGIITTKGNIDECETSSINKLTNVLKDQYQRRPLPYTEAQSLFWNAYRHAAKHPVYLKNLPSTRNALSYQIKKYNQCTVDDTSIGNIDELRSFIFHFYFSGCYAEFWKKLGDEDKTSFTRLLYGFILAYLTGITPLNAQLLLKLFDRNQIIERNGLSSIQYNDEKKRFVLQFVNGDIEEAEYLIDSSGLGYDISKKDRNFPLLTNLVTKGFIVPAKFGGIELNENGQAFDKDNQLQTNLFCIGPVASYCHPIPTPYASFIALETIQKALSVLNGDETTLQCKMRAAL